MYDNIIETLEKYRENFPEDTQVVKYFEFLQNPENMGEKCVDRKNFNGHITVSAFVLRNGEGAAKVLTLWHKTFQKSMQPGGHIDPPDKNIFDAAIREVKEETGLDVERRTDIFGQIPISLDAHPIKTNEKKQEDAHTHFDACFLLKLKDEKQNIENTDEGVDDAKWILLSDITESSNNVLWRAAKKFKELNLRII